MKQFQNLRSFGRAVRGVTLVELMVVMLIIGILTAIAYPSYGRYVARSHRNAAAACLSQFAQAMERRYTTTLSYAGADINLACEQDSDLDRFYTIGFVPGSLSQSTYTVQAAPTTVQSGRDAVNCGTLSIDQRGTRTPNNNACW